MRSSHHLLPPDATPEEIDFLEYSVVNLYKAIEKKEDMFLVAFIHELGYKKRLAAEILGLSPASITSRLKKIKERLKARYAKNRIKK